MSLLERIKELCKENGISQRKLEKDLGLGNAASSKWSKSSPSIDLLQKLSSYFGVTIDYLNGSSKFKTKEEEFINIKKKLECNNKTNKSKSIKIPVLGKVIAGIPIEAIENIIDYEEIPAEFALLGQYFALKVQGNSMEPRICENDVLIIKKQTSAESGEVVIALINSEEATCKKLIKHKDGISLVSFNSSYEPMYFSNKDIVEKPVQIIGKVIENRQKY